MASGKSSYLRNALLNLAVGGTAWTPPGTLYVALSTAAWAASATGTSIASTEPTGAAAYSRKSSTNDTLSWPTATTGVKSNGGAIQFSTATGGWGLIKSFYLVDAATAGNILYGGDLYTERYVLIGDSPKFATGQLQITET